MRASRIRARRLGSRYNTSTDIKSLIKEIDHGASEAQNAQPGLS
jgi:hypothetical protein